MVNAKSRSARLIEVIEVITSTGKGTENDPNRFVTEYWAKDGELLAVCDPFVTAFVHQTSLD